MAVAVQLGKATQVDLHVVGSEAIHHAESNRSLRAENPHPTYHPPNFALLRLVQTIREVALKQSSLWRRILDVGWFVTA